MGRKVKHEAMTTLPSVTAILAPWSRFDGVPEAVLAAAADRGTRVHNACKADVSGLWVLPDPEVAPYLESFRLWLLRRVVRVISAEAEYVDLDLCYKGHPDLVVILKGDTAATIIDLKTPLTKNPLWRPQIAAYKHLVEKAGLEVGRTGSLRLSPRGLPPLLDEYTGSLAADLAGFMSALYAWRYFNALKERMV
jgi:hypothetical protein